MKTSQITSIIPQLSADMFCDNDSSEAWYVDKAAHAQLLTDIADRVNALKQLAADAGCLSAGKSSLKVDSKAAIKLEKMSKRSWADRFAQVICHADALRVIAGFTCESIELNQQTVDSCRYDLRLTDDGAIKATKAEWEKIHADRRNKLQQLTANA